MNIQKTAEWILTQYKTFIFTFLMCWIVFGVFIFNAMEVQSIWLIGMICLTPFIILEGGLRLIFRLAYGHGYRNSFLNYFLIDHPVYGNAFRSNCHSKGLDFFIFDKFVFRFGLGRILDLKKNIEERVDFNVNTLGFRGKEFSPDKKAGKVRIFCIGGSTTACDCNDDHESWPAQLEQCLNEQGYDVEVINAGVQGWYSYQDNLRFHREIINYQADIILVHQGWNEEFEYSSLSLGKEWKPKVARNVREEHNLYCAPNRFLSSTILLSIYLTTQNLLKEYKFNPSMRFTNPQRWLVLKNNEYILAWFDNLVEMARCAKERSIDMYTVDYPGLASMRDSVKERDFYVEHSRLTPSYADYQAVSKNRISRALKACQPGIPRINAAEDFLAYRNQERLALFLDEIHLAPAGNALMARSIAKQLIADETFQRRYTQPQGQFSNAQMDDATTENSRKKLMENAAHVDRFIDQKIKKLKYPEALRKPKYSEIPEDRYTTF